jgi:AraC-like DNA-binding protein
MTANKIRKTVTPIISTVRSAAFWDKQLTPFADSGLCHCGIDERPAGVQWGDVISPTHLVFFAIRGSIAYVTSQPPIILHEGEWLAVPQGGSRYFVAGPGGAVLLWFHFQTGSDWDILREHALQPSPASRAPILHAVMEALLMEYVTPGPAAREACGRLSGLMLHYLHRELIPEYSPAQRSARERLTALWTRLHGELAKPWTVAQMAQLANMSESQFARVVQSLYQMSPMKMLLSLRMEHAAALLRNSSATLESVAQDCGYASAYAFSTAFHRYFGNRPGRYRRGA